MIPIPTFTQLSDMIFEMNMSHTKMICIKYLSTSWNVVT